MRITETRFQNLLIFGAAALVWTTFGPTNVLATALPIGNGGTIIVQNLPGSFAGFTTIPFCFNWGGGGSCAGALHGMAVSGTSNLVVTPSTGNIKDLSALTAVSGFETMTGGGILAGQTVNFDLVSIPVSTVAIGNCASNAANNMCTPTDSAFTLTEDNTGTVVTIQFTANLAGYTGTSGSGTTPYTALFSTQESGTMTGAGACVGLTANITNILTCESLGGTISGGFLGTSACCEGAPAPAVTNGAWSLVESPAPEPVSFGLMASGLFGLAFGGRGLRRRMGQRTSRRTRRT
jgi:hypothetical protein